MQQLFSLDAVVMFGVGQNTCHACVPAALSHQRFVRRYTVAAGVAYRVMPCV